MEKRYIQVNEVTRPYLRSLRHTDSEDPKILRGLAHDREWWARFNSESSKNKRNMLNFISKKKLKLFKL